MRRLVLAVVTVLASAAVVSAQPTITASPYVVGVGASTNITLQGTPGDNYVLVSSSTTTGFSYAGVDFAVGLDLALVSIGVIPGGGSVVVPFAPPFPARDRIYLQAITSPSPAFVPPTGSNGVVILNNQEARLYMPVGGLVLANGTISFATPGVTVTRNGPGNYTINFAGLFNIPAVITQVTPSGGATLTSLQTNSNQAIVQLSADANFAFISQVIRR